MISRVGGVASQRALVRLRTQGCPWPPRAVGRRQRAVHFTQMMHRRRRAASAWGERCCKGLHDARCGLPWRDGQADPLLARRLEDSKRWDLYTTPSPRELVKHPPLVLQRGPALDVVLGRDEVLLRDRPRDGRVLVLLGAAEPRHREGAGHEDEERDDGLRRRPFGLRRRRRPARTRYTTAGTFERPPQLNWGRP